MSISHVKPENIELIREDSNNLSFRQLANVNSHGADVSLTWVEINGAHRSLVTNKSTRVYYLLEGSFVFNVFPEDEILASAGDIVVIPRSQKYSFLGSGKYLVINGPAFQEGDDIYQP